MYDVKIGESFEGRPIMAYALMLGTNPAEAQNELKARNSILLNGVHHARELTTIS